MKLRIVKLAANQSTVNKLIKHFNLNPESGDKYPKIHAITYYTEAKYFKITWDFNSESEVNAAKDWTTNQVDESTEVYTTIEKSHFFMTVKFHGYQKLKDLEEWIGVKGTKQYFANQIVYRYYIK